MDEELKLIAETTRELENLNLPDSYRVANEIVQHFRGNTEKIHSAITRIGSNEPWEYIRGYTQFRNIKINVNRHTLIPRIETEQIIDIAKESLSKNKDIRTVIDVGTGSGAIAYALYNETNPKDINIIALDKSKEALEVAKQNLERTKVKLTKSDLLSNISIDLPTLVIANLPYIPTEIYKSLDPSVKEYEPESALDGGKDGTLVIEELLTQCSQIDNVKTIILEIDPVIMKRVRQLSEEILPYKKARFIEDYRDQIRFVLLED